MLQAMRERVQGIIAIAIVAIVSLTFAVWGIQNYLQARGGGDVVAKVDGVKITTNQLEAAYSRTKQQLMRQMKKTLVLDQQAQNKLKQQVLQEIVNSEAVFQNAKKMGFQISPEQIDAVLTHLPAFQEGGHFSVGRFQQVLSGMLYSEAEFIADMRRNMTLDQLQTGIVSSAFILPNEVNDIVKLTQQKRDFGYMIIPVAKFMQTVKVTDTDIQQYYQQNQQQFQTPEKVSIAYVELSADKLKAKIHVTAQEMQQFYNDNIDLYSHPKRWLVTRIFVPVPEDAGTSAVKQAKVKVDSLGKQEKSYSKPVWLMQGEVSQTFVNELQKLKVGEISDPFRTKDGFYIVKLLQIKPAQVLSFSKVQNRVKEALIQQKSTQLFDQENDKLADLTYTNSSTLAVAAKQLNLTIQTTDLFTRQGGKTGLLSNSKVVSAAFSDIVLQQNYNSNPIEIAPGRVVVLRVKQHKPVAVQPLAQVKDFIEQQLKTKLAQQKAQDLGQKLLTSVQQGEPAKKIAAQNGLAWKTVAKAKRQMTGINNQIIAAAFNLPLPQPGKPSVTGVSLDNNGYAIAQLTKVYPGDPKQLSKKQQQLLKRNLEINFGQTDYELYVKNAVQKARIKILTQDEK